eukprot:TRINITY_DN5145_c0_g1_i2.p1 TRINITY_DN5145_c0_g1~~TRINITY_DN5145_c0_g1_i2.p1  ORF type:complete len:301 (+),score=43.94 TRINITY_DN5145_c0_g1_i2:59-904(+)
MESSSKRRHIEMEDSGTVVFNVSGRHFEVLRQTIEARPSTLLAALLEDVGTDSKRPIFVDACPDRFGHILDWYRFGEMYVPEQQCPIQGLLREARFYLLPDIVRINGMSYSLRPGAANNAFDVAEAAIVDQWPGFEKYVEQVLSETQKELKALGEQSKTVKNLAAHQIALSQRNGQIPHDHFDMDKLPKKSFIVASAHRSGHGYEWCDPENICNKERLQVMLAGLKKRGFDGEIVFASGDVQLRVGVGTTASAPGQSGAKLDGVRGRDERLSVYNAFHAFG